MTLRCLTAVALSAPGCDADLVGLATGGFSDRLFTMVDLLSRGRDAAWPWERKEGAPDPPGVHRPAG